MRGKSPNGRGAVEASPALRLSRPTPSRPRFRAEELVLGRSLAQLDEAFEGDANGLLERSDDGERPAPGELALELATQKPRAQVRPIARGERTAFGTAEGAAGLLAAGRTEPSRGRSRERERVELIIGEIAIRRPAAAVPSRPFAKGKWVANGAARARLDRTERQGQALAALAELARQGHELAAHLARARERGETTTELEELGCALPLVTEPIDQVLSADEHPRSVAEFTSRTAARVEKLSQAHGPSRDSGPRGRHPARARPRGAHRGGGWRWASS